MQPHVSSCRMRDKCVVTSWWSEFRIVSFVVSQMPTSIWPMGVVCQYHTLQVQLLGLMLNSVVKEAHPRPARPGHSTCSLVQCSTGSLRGPLQNGVADPLVISVRQGTRMKFDGTTLQPLSLADIERVPYRHLISGVRKPGRTAPHLWHDSLVLSSPCQFIDLPCRQGVWDAPWPFLDHHSGYQPRGSLLKAADQHSHIFLA